MGARPSYRPQLDRLSAGALEGLLFGVQHVDGPTLGLVVAAVLGVGLAAGVVPAWRGANRPGRHTPARLTNGAAL